MARSLQIIYRLLFIFLIGNFFSAQEKWHYSAEEMEQKKIDGDTIRRLNNNVHFSKTNQLILTDNALQYIKDDVLYLNGNTSKSFPARFARYVCFAFPVYLQ